MLPCQRMSSFKFLQLASFSLCTLASFLLGRCVVRCALIPNVTTTEFDGNVAYFAVPRRVIADKLRQLTAQSSGCAADKLTLPDYPVLPSLISSDQHLVAITVGRLTAKTFDEAICEPLEKEYVTIADTVQFFIPFLTAEDTHAVPKYKLALGSYVSTKKHFIQPNPTIPIKEVDDVIVTKRRAFVRDGPESFEMVFPKFRECANIDKIILAEYEDYIEEFTLSFDVAPDYCFCANAAFANLGLCTHQISCDSCQYWSHGKVDNCYVPSVRLGKVTQRFEEMFCLTEIEGPSVLSMDMEGIFNVGLNTGCI